MKNRKVYSIHDELGSDYGNLGNEYCVHIFIAKKDEMFFCNDNSVLPQANSLPQVRNGSLTFIKYDNTEYGITCGHVVDALESFNRKNDIEMSKFCELPLPPIAKYHFFVSINNHQHHVNANFHIVPTEFGMPQLDIAIAKLPPKFVTLIGRKCIKIHDWPDESIMKDSSLTGIACGYPEMNRTSRETDKDGINLLGKGFVSLVAKFESLTKDRIRLIHLVDETSGVNVLSGMSGGPLFWSTNNDWGLAGIIKVGGDLKPNIQSDNENEVFEPTINVVAEPITKEKIEDWIKQMPNEKFPESLSSMMYIPKNFNGFRT